MAGRRIGGLTWGERTGRGEREEEREGGRVCRLASARGGRNAEKSFRSGGDAAEGAARRRGQGRRAAGWSQP